MRNLYNRPRAAGAAFGFGKAPPSVQADIARQFRADGHEMLVRGAPPSAGFGSPGAHRALQTVWSRLDEMFLHSGLLRRWRPVRFVTKTLAAMSINGCAGQAMDPSSPFFFVGLHAGLFIHTADRLLRILSDPRAFPQLGAASMEQAGRTGAILDLVPRDPNREATAMAMATVAIAAVFAHEVGHIVHGHIWLLRSRFGLTRLYEAGAPQGGSPTDLNYVVLRRAMELDADLFAGKVIGTFLFDRQAPDWCGALGKDRRGLLHLLALALTCTFRTFEEQSPDDLYHTPFLRAQLMTTAARNRAAADVPFELDDFKSSAWLPEFLNILGPTAGRLDSELLRSDLDSMMQTYRSAMAVQEEFETARVEMNTVLSRARI